MRGVMAGVCLMFTLATLPLSVAAAPASTELEVLATEDAVGSDTQSEGLDILEVSFGSAWSKDDESVYVHLELRKSPGTPPPSVERPWRIEITYPYPPGKGYSLVSTNGHDWASAEMHGLHYERDGDLIHFWRAFAPHSISPGNAWLEPVVRSFVGSDLRDVAPGLDNLVLGAGQVVPDVLATQRRGVVDNEPVTPRVSDYFGMPRATRIGNVVTLVVPNPLSQTQHIRLVPGDVPQGWDFEPLINQTEIPPGASANLSFVADGYGASESFSIHARSDEGGNLWMYFGNTGDLHLQLRQLNLSDPNEVYVFELLESQQPPTQQSSVGSSAMLGIAILVTTAVLRRRRH